MKGVGWTCPAIDRLIRIVRRHVPEPERTAAIAGLELLRADNSKLREQAGEEMHDEQNTLHVHHHFKPELVAVFSRIERHFAASNRTLEKLMANITEIKAQLDRSLTGQGKIDVDIQNIKTAFEALNTTNATLVQTNADQQATIEALIAAGSGATQAELEELLVTTTAIGDKLVEQDAALDAVAPDAPNEPNEPV